jgi:hypothetical protein
MSICLNDAELSALNGLPYMTWILYAGVIRRYMDYETGLVGAGFTKFKKKISWQAIREFLYVEPESGVTAQGSPSKDQVRRAAKKLEKIGLISIISQRKQLIFKCLLADTDRSAQNQAATRPPYQPDTQAATATAKIIPIKSNINLLFDSQAATEADIPETGQAAIQPETDVILTKVSITNKHPHKYSQTFERFWKCYPRKEDKTKAYEVWKRKKLELRADELIADVEKRKQKHSTWLKGFIPHAKTYFNGQRWEDDITEEANEIQRTYTPKSRPVSARENAIIKTIEQCYPGSFSDINH